MKWDVQANFSPEATPTEKDGVDGANQTWTTSTWTPEKMLDVFRESQMKYDEIGSQLLIGFYAPLFVLAASTNIIVIVVVCKYHYMRSVTNYFLVNLSLADLLVTLICMPMAITRAITNLWMYGSTMCKLTFYLQGVAVGASVFTITAMSIDRYLAIRYPMAFRKIFNRKTTILVIVILWIVALVIFLPLLWVSRIEVEVGELVWCTENWENFTSLRTWYGLACFIIVYLIPGVVVVLAYSLMGRSLCAAPPFSGQCSKSTQGYRLVRERRRVARILLLLALLFALCWLPYNVLYLIIDLEILSKENIQTANYVLPFTLFLGHANSAINPVIYCFMTKNLRTTIKELVFRSRLTLARRHHQRHKVSDPGTRPAGLAEWPPRSRRRRRQVSSAARAEWFRTGNPAVFFRDASRAQYPSRDTFHHIRNTSDRTEREYSEHPRGSVRPAREPVSVNKPRTNTPPSSPGCRRAQTRSEQHRRRTATL